MKFHVVDRRPGQVPLGALVMLPLFGLPLGAWAVTHGHLDFGTCGMKRMFELPCISCGSTRATIHLLHGDVLTALAHQPMMMGVFAALLLWGAVSLVSFARNRRVIVEMSRAEDITFKASLIAIPLLNWAYLIWAGI